mgnify:CR=1 FL=1
MKKRIPFRLILGRSKAKDQGAILPLAAVGITSLIGMMGLSLDVGNVLVARQELRSAAEAASLTGVTYLSQGTTLPNFSLATSNAQASVVALNNTSNGQPLKNATVTPGLYDTSGAQPSFQPLKPPYTYTPNSTQVPAVQVVITKDASAGGNGVVNTLFAKVLGINSFSPQASAIAIGHYAPASAAPGQVLPLTIPQSVMNNLWDPLTHQPLLNKSGSSALYTNTDQGANSAPVTKSGEPYRVRIWDNACNLNVPQTLPSSAGDKAGKKLTDSEDDDHEEDHGDDDYPIAGAWHTYEDDADQTCTSSNDDCSIKNKTELKTASYSSDHHDLHFCTKNSEAQVRQRVVSACQGAKYAGYVAVVDRCSHAGKTGAIQSFAAVNIIGSGKEFFSARNPSNRNGKDVSCDYVDIQLIPPGQKEAHAADDDHHDGDHEDDDDHDWTHTELSNAKEFSCRLEGKGVAKQSYVSTLPKVIN